MSLLKLFLDTPKPVAHMTQQGRFDNYTYNSLKQCVVNYGASEASVVFRRLSEINEYERPAGRGHAFEKLISQQPLDRFTCGNFCTVTSSLLPTCGQ